MTVTIDLETKTETKLRKLAKSKGQNLEYFLKQMAEREANMAPVSLSEAASPLYNWTKKQGYSEQEIEEFVDDLITDVRRETPLSSR